jgi:hypothetical protein
MTVAHADFCLNVTHGRQTLEMFARRIQGVNPAPDPKCVACLEKASSEFVLVDFQPLQFEDRD